VCRLRFNKPYVTMTAHRVLIVEDNNTTAEFIRQQLVEGGLIPEVAPTGLEALRRVHIQTYALAVVDIDITAEPNGVETADWLRRLYGIPVVILSMRIDAEIGSRAAAARPAGYVSRPEAGELTGLISSVMSVWSVPVTRPQPVAEASGRAQVIPPGQKVTTPLPPGFAQLSGREWQIILDLIDKPSAKAVAQKRERSPHTVHNHLKSIFRKLQVHSVADLLSLLMRVSRQVPIV
jgi:DNA-binding NarL/FixJ family response regulator